MVTASHNPANYNGFKILLGKMPITPQDIAEIKKRVEGKCFRPQLDSYVRRTVRTLESRWRVAASTYPGA